MIINFGAYFLSMSWAIMGVAVSYGKYIEEKKKNY